MRMRWLSLLSFTLLWVILNCSSQQYPYSDFEQCYLHHCPNYTHKSTIVTTTGFHKNLTIPKTCLIGHGHSNVGDAKQHQSSHSNNTHELCRNRGIHERRFGPKSINNVYVRFLDTLLSSGVRRIFLLGDSITIQLGNFLSCDLLRAGFAMEPGSLNMFLNKAQGGSDIVLNPSGNGSLAITSIRTDVPCIYTPCENISKSVTQFTNSVMWKFLKTPGTIVVFNYGLHFHRSVRDIDQIQAALAEQMLILAKRAKSSNSTLGFRETTAQHFQSEDGLFEHIVNYNSSDFCCVAPKTTYDIDYRDESIIKTLDDVDSAWRKSLAWFKFYTHSNQLFDTHTEKTGRRVDCSHYVYDVDMSIGLLQSILDGVIGLAR